MVFEYKIIRKISNTFISGDVLFQKDTIEYKQINVRIKISYFSIVI